MATGTLAITGDHDADHLLNTDPLALLLGMLLDQQVPMEWAFMGPYRLADRLGADLGADTIAAMDPDQFASLVKEKPALHRFPGSMAGRIQQLCQQVDRTPAIRSHAHAVDGPGVVRRRGRHQLCTDGRGHAAPQFGATALVSG